MKYSAVVIYYSRSALEDIFLFSTKFHARFDLFLKDYAQLQDNNENKIGGSI